MIFQQTKRGLSTESLDAENVGNDKAENLKSNRLVIIAKTNEKLKQHQKQKASEVTRFSKNERIQKKEEDDEAKDAEKEDIVVGEKEDIVGGGQKTAKHKENR